MKFVYQLWKECEWDPSVNYILLHWKVTKSSVLSLCLQKSHDCAKELKRLGGERCGVWHIRGNANMIQLRCSEKKLCKTREHASAC